MSVIELGLIGCPRHDIAETGFDVSPLLFAVAEHSRLSLRSAFDSCLNVVDAFAEDVGVQSFYSLRRLAHSEDLQGLIWSRNFTPAAVDFVGAGPLQYILLSENLLDPQSLPGLIRLAEVAARNSMEVLPGLTCRWLPTTLRLRELIATQLGPIQELSLHVNPAALTVPERVQLVDWVRMLVCLKQVEVTRLANGQGVQLAFERPQGVSICHVEFSDKVERPALFGGTSPIDVVCRHGNVRIHNGTQLDWETDREHHDESLSRDRTAESVLLDLFARRLAGGVIPVPDLHEVFRTMQLITTIEAVLQDGRQRAVDESRPWRP